MIKEYFVYVNGKAVDTIYAKDLQDAHEKAEALNYITSESHYVEIRENSYFY